MTAVFCGSSGRERGGTGTGGQSRSRWYPVLPSRTESGVSGRRLTPVCGPSTRTQEREEGVPIGFTTTELEDGRVPRE